MGIAYKRPYRDILQDVAAAIRQHTRYYEWFGMTAADWGELTEDEQAGFATTLADDVLYGLGGGTGALVFGSCRVSYDRRRSVVLFRTEGSGTVQIIFLK